MRGLGPLSGPMCAVLGRSWGLCGRSWVALRSTVGGLGQLLGLMWVVLGPLRAILGRSWASVGGLGPLSVPSLAILDRSWDLCWRSWAILGRKVAPNLSGKAIWQADLGREVVRTRAGRQSRGRKSGGAGAVPERCRKSIVSGAGPLYVFFL